MSSIRRGHAALLLLALTLSLAFASVDHEKKDTESLNETILRYLQGPWLDGLNWIANSQNTSGVKEARAFVRALESGETWAAQILEVVQSRSKISEENIQDVRTHDRIDEVETKGGDNNDPSSSLGERRPADKTRISQILIGINFSEPGNNIFLPDSNKTPFSIEEICAIVLFSTVVAFMIACTICDIVERNGYKSSSNVNTLAKFSLYTNAVDLLSTKVAPDTMPALHGMKFLSMCSIMLSHRYMMLVIVLTNKISILDILEWKSSWLATIVWIARHCVDTFFVISGFLITYHTLKSMRSGSKLNFLTMYLSRYLRLTPSLAAVVLFIVVFPHRLGSGAVWERAIISQSNTCRENWWVNLLYVQNIVKLDTLCLLPTWYLAVDMQLFLVSPFILYLLHRWPKFGLGTIGVLFTASMIGPAIIMARMYGQHNGGLRLDMDMSTQFQFFVFSYVPTLPRGVPYLIGMLLGYDLANKRRLFSQMTVIINWIVAIILLILSMWLTGRSIHSNFAYSQSREVIFALIIRPSWSIGIAWIVYACTQGYGGIVARFLSLPIFIPLSRLSYCTFLVHIGIQIGNLALTHTSASVFGIQNIHGLFGDILMSIAAAFVLSLFFESPSIVLKRILQNRFRQSEPTFPIQASNKTVDAAIEEVKPSRTSGKRKHL